MSTTIDGKAVLVTGANRGIGQALVTEALRRGASRVYAGTRQPYAHQDPRVTSLELDITNEAHVRAAAAQVGSLDILVNNAGVQTWKALLELEEREWDRVIDTNLKGCFLCTQRAARQMKTQGGGRIINIGSGCNKVAFPHLVDYTASKGGIEMFTKVSAAELGPHGITVNCVAPGAIEIERTKQEAGDYAATWAGLTPLGRIGTPLDVARAVVFFASEMADFVSGQTLWVDGGLFTKPAWPY